jgi:hypothetical protein
MKIVQTLWLRDSSNIYHEKAGWYLPEYHWMAWALSCLQLRQYYEEVELVTNQKGKEILIDQLQLPYTKVTIIEFNELTNQFWSLAKVQSYQLQNEPFIHVDGDVFIWQAFDNEIIKGDLIAQNSEDWFSGYDYILEKFKESNRNLPSFIDNYDLLESYNLGVVGGKEANFFKKYSTEVDEFVENNKVFLSDLVDTFIHSYVNMFIEQFMFTQLATSKKLSISTILPNKITDPDYPEITNFYHVPRTKKFVHLMGRSKGVQEICRTLGKIIRRHYPTYYYRIIQCSLENNVELDCKVYHHPEIGLILGKMSDYEWITNVLNEINFKNSKNISIVFEVKSKDFDLKNEVQIKDFQNYESSKKTFQNDLKNFEFYYAKEVLTFSNLEDLFMLSEENFDSKLLQFDDSVRLIESTWDWSKEDFEELKTQPEGFFQTLLIPDIYSMTIREQSLDSLNMILLDAFVEPNKIFEAIKTCALYYEESENISEDFKFLIRERIRELMNWGTLRLL